MYINDYLSEDQITAKHTNVSLNESIQPIFLIFISSLLPLRRAYEI